MHSGSGCSNRCEAWYLLLSSRWYLQLFVVCACAWSSVKCARVGQWYLSGKVPMWLAAGGKLDSHWVQWGEWHWKFQISFWHDSCFCNEIASSRNTELKNIKCWKRCAGRLAKKDCANEFAKRGCIYCLEFMKSEDSLTDHCIQCQYVDASPIGQVSNCHFFPCIFVQLLSLGMEVFQNVLTSPSLTCVWSFPYVWNSLFWSYRS
jgi:hypothetical protein